MGRSRAASAPQYVGKPNHLRDTRASGAGCRQVQCYDGARCPIVLLEPPRLCAGLCHRHSVASHWRVGRFLRWVVANPLANSVGIEAPSGGRSGTKHLATPSPALSALPRILLKKSKNRAREKWSKSEF